MCDELDQNKFIMGLYSTPAMKNNLILKKQQIRGWGNLLLATTLALGCGVIDRYRRLSMNAGATWKHGGLHPPLWGAWHFPLNISFGPALLLQIESPAPASRGTGLSPVVSRNKSVGIPSWFLHGSFQWGGDVTEVCAVPPNKISATLLSLLFQRCRQPLKEAEERSGTRWSRSPLFLHPREKSSPGAVI